MTNRDQAFAVRTTFNLDVPAEVITAGFADTRNPRVPSRDEDYVFRRKPCGTS